MSVDIKKRTYLYFRRDDGSVCQAHHGDTEALYRYQQKGYNEIHYRFFRSKKDGTVWSAFSDDQLYIQQYSSALYEELSIAYEPLPALEAPEPAKKQRARTRVKKVTPKE